MKIGFSHGKCDIISDFSILKWKTFFPLLKEKKYVYFLCVHGRWHTQVRGHFQQSVLSFHPVRCWVQFRTPGVGAGAFSCRATWKRHLEEAPGRPDFFFFFWKATLTGISLGRTGCSDLVITGSPQGTKGLFFSLLRNFITEAGQMSAGLQHFSFLIR